MKHLKLFEDQNKKPRVGDCIFEHENGYVGEIIEVSFISGTLRYDVLFKYDGKTNVVNYF